MVNDSHIYGRNRRTYMCQNAYNICYWQRICCRYDTYMCYAEEHICVKRREHICVILNIYAWAVLNIFRLYLVKKKICVFFTVHICWQTNIYVVHHRTYMLVFARMYVEHICAHASICVFLEKHLCSKQHIYVLTGFRRFGTNSLFIIVRILSNNNIYVRDK